MPNPTSTQQGFTLLELMITVSIAAILLAIAIPSFQSTMASTQLATQTNNFLTAMATARDRAIKDNTRATLCTSNTGTACTISNWADGWLVWVDTNRSGTMQATEITTVGQAVNGLVITGTAPVANAITYQSDGTSLGGASGVIGICKATTSVAENLRNITITASGEARVARVNTAGVCP
ncbi:MAG: GspH/FimT family pseudopilin [Halothiobacillaceae bacterium]|nr:GspH/FimT family pseudopilin [Halothiobacillaceae bacterium]